MAPKRVNKRAREAAEEKAVADSAPAEKVAKQSDVLKPVAEAIETADLPDSCRAMLLSFVPVCLDSPREERDSLQSLAVDMLSKFFASRRACMKKAIEDESAKLVEWEANAGDLDAKVAAAERELAEKGEASLEVKKKELAVASQAMVATKAAATDAKEAQKAGDVTHQEALEEQQGVEAILKDNLVALKEGNWEAAKAQGCIEGLMPLAKRLKLDPSLISAMPSSLIKAPSERGPFDLMVIQQLEEILHAKAKSLAEQIQADGPAVQERAAAVDVAQHAAEEAKQRQQQAASAVFEAQAVVKDLQAALDETKATKESFAPKFREAAGVRDRKMKELEVFETVSLVSFEKLKDRTTSEMSGAADKTKSEEAPTPSKVVEQPTSAAMQVAVGGQ